MKFHVWSPGYTGFQGGIGAFSRELAMALGDLGHELKLIGKLDSAGEWRGMPIWGAGGVPSLLRTPAFIAGALGACARHRPDQVISTHVNFGPAAHWAKRTFGIPFTLVAHGVDVNGALATARRASLRVADRVLAVSEWTRRRVLDLGGIDAARVTVVPNTVDDLRFAVGAKPAGLALRYGLQAGEKVVLTVARLESGEGYKGYDKILKALPAIEAEAGKVRFLLVGAGEDRLSVEAMVRAMRIERAVTITGFVPDDELADHYRLADVFAMPSTGEGFGVVFLEAMACGTPVLAGNCDGSVDALGGGRFGRLVDPRDVAAVANGITDLLHRRGPAWWFDRQKLHDTVIERFGRAAFRRRLRDVLGW